MSSIIRGHNSSKSCAGNDIFPPAQVDLDLCISCIWSDIWIASWEKCHYIICKQKRHGPILHTNITLSAQFNSIRPICSQTVKACLYRLSMFAGRQDPFVLYVSFILLLTLLSLPGNISFLFRCLHSVPPVNDYFIVSFVERIDKDLMKKMETAFMHSDPSFLYIIFSVIR